MKIFKLIIPLLALLSLGACAHPSAGFYVQRTDTMYDVHVRLNGYRADGDLYRGAYEICKRDKNAGFEILTRSNRILLQTTSMMGTVQCKGEVDPFLEKKYSNSKERFLVEDSNRMFNGGKKFRWVSE